ncbi:hypothetical protein F2Q69_00005070 [Brassica cretica]|uniref:DUF4283 domain-containing protein n=1 Tax=Brassica cretica TaxID=69181 RepID=A0A8S9NTY6_BRACR|nr:hypothetical protein F2Q69_00005070 [Brassica cretica]
MFRLHFAYMSPYQILEYHMKFLETFGCIWSSKEVFKVIIGRAAHESDQSGATPSSRSDLPIRATGKGRSRFHHPETRERVRSDLSQRHSEVAPEAWSDLSERRAENWSDNTYLLFNKQSLSRLATAIGKPVSLALETERKENFEVAKMWVRVNLLSDLPKRIVSGFSNGREVDIRVSLLIPSDLKTDNLKQKGDRDAETKLSESMDIPESDNGRAPSVTVMHSDQASDRQSARIDTYQDSSPFFLVSNRKSGRKVTRH